MGYMTAYNKYVHIDNKQALYNYGTQNKKSSHLMPVTQNYGWGLSPVFMSIVQKNYGQRILCARDCWAFRNDKMTMDFID